MAPSTVEAVLFSIFRVASSWMLSSTKVNNTGSVPALLPMTVSIFPDGQNLLLFQLLLDDFQWITLRHVVSTGFVRLFLGVSGKFFY